MKLIAYAQSDVGRRRSENQDRVLCHEEHGLFVVCDGMGGHAAGEVAAELARDEVARDVESDMDVLRELLGGDTVARRDAAERVRRAVERANRVVYAASEDDVSRRGMGTTLTLLLVQGDRAIAAQVGDSRLYLVRAGEAYQVTSDHTILAELTRAGKLESLTSSPERNLNALTRAVGVHPEVEVDTLEFEVLPGDVFLLCSDGLHGYFDDLDLVEFFHHSSRSAAAGNLIDMALKRGGHDNISAVTVFVGEGDSERLNQFRLTLETVKSIPLFHYLSFSELLRVIRVCELRAVNAGTVLIEESSDSADFFIVLDGVALVHRAGVELATLGAGKYFGEMSMVDNRPRSATVTMKTDGRVIRITRPDFYELLRGDSVLAVKILWNFIQTLSAMVRNNNDKGAATFAVSAAVAKRDAEGPNDEKE